MVGDLQRLRKYPELGFMCVYAAATSGCPALATSSRVCREPSHIPPSVWAAYERLVEIGFTRHLLQ